MKELKGIVGEKPITDEEIEDGEGVADSGIAAALRFGVGNQRRDHFARCRVCRMITIKRMRRTFRQ